MSFCAIRKERAKVHSKISSPRCFYDKLSPFILTSLSKPTTHRVWWIFPPAHLTPHDPSHFTSLRFSFSVFRPNFLPPREPHTADARSPISSTRNTKVWKRLVLAFTFLTTARASKQSQSWPRRRWTCFFGCVSSRWKSFCKLYSSACELCCVHFGHVSPRWVVAKCNEEKSEKFALPEGHFIKTNEGPPPKINTTNGVKWESSDLWVGSTRSLNWLLTSQLH